jgi:hypothetical protein
MTPSPVTEATRKDDEGPCCPLAMGGLSKTRRGFRSARFPTIQAPEDAR